MISSGNMHDIQSFTFAERIMHMSQRFTLTALRSALLRGEPWIWNISFLSMNCNAYIQD